MSSLDAELDIVFFLEVLWDGEVGVVRDGGLEMTGDVFVVVSLDNKLDSDGVGDV